MIFFSYHEYRRKIMDHQQRIQNLMPFLTTLGPWMKFVPSQVATNKVSFQNSIPPYTEVLASNTHSEQKFKKFAPEIKEFLFISCLWIYHTHF